MPEIAVDTRSVAERRSALNQRIKDLFVENLGLSLESNLIGDDQPIFGRGLELDSLDTLEIVVMIDEEFGVSISDDQRAVFGSINRIADFVVDQLGEIPEVSS